MEVSWLRRLAGRLNLILMGVLALVIWILVALLATRPSMKTLWDVSPQAQFTLTPETEELISDMRAKGLELEIDTFFSPLPRSANDVTQSHLINIQKRVRELTRDLLQQFAYLGGDAVKVVHYDLLTDIEAVRNRIGEIGQLRTQNTLVLSLGKRRKVLSVSLDLADIEFPQGQRQVAPGTRQALPTLKLYKGEEAISLAIRSLLVEGTPKVYFMSDSSSVSLTQATANSYSELMIALEKEGFELGILDLGGLRQVPADAAALAWMEPYRGLSPELAQVVHDYLRRGGRMLINYSFRNQPPDWNPRFENLGKLLGFEVGEELVCHLLPDNQAGVAQVQNLVLQASPVHPTTQPLVRSGRRPVLKVARELRALANPPQGVKVDNGYLVTGPGAWRAPRVGPNGEVTYQSPARQSDFSQISVGASIDIEQVEGDRPGHLVMVGGVAFLNGEGFQRVNGDLALNIFNWMVQRHELVTVRGNRYRPQRLELQPHQLSNLRWLLIAGVPGGLLLLSVLVFFLRMRN